MDWNGHQIPKLQELINENKYQSYLEVGIQHGVTLFNLNVDRKVGVDAAITKGLVYNKIEYFELQKLVYRKEPNLDIFIMKSDDYFKHNKETFDMIFVDGWHSKNQAYDDIMNSLNCLNVGGTIAVHDTIPPDAKAATPDVLQEEGAWCGDVWKAIVDLRCNRNDLQIYTIGIPVGLTIIKPIVDGQVACLDRKYLDYTWEQFDKEKGYILNIK